jgi:hypothetical protein
MLNVGVMKDKRLKTELCENLMFIMNQESESYRQDLYMSVGVMKD